MNVLESLEAHLAYRDYVAAYQKTAADGSPVDKTEADGRTTRYYANGLQVADASTWTTFDGVQVHMDAAGWLTANDAHGNALNVRREVVEGGFRFAIAMGAGCTRRIYSDGRDQQITDGGSIDTRFASGARMAMLSDG